MEGNEVNVNGDNYLQDPKYPTPREIKIGKEKAYVKEYLVKAGEGPIN